MGIEFSTGGEAAARALVDHGVDTIFTLSGGHLNPIYAHLENTAQLTFTEKHLRKSLFVEDQSLQ